MSEYGRHGEEELDLEKVGLEEKEERGWRRRRGGIGTKGGRERESGGAGFTCEPSRPAGCCSLHQTLAPNFPCFHHHCCCCCCSSCCCFVSHSTRSPRTRLAPGRTCTSNRLAPEQQFRRESEQTFAAACTNQGSSEQVSILKPEPFLQWRQSCRRSTCLHKEQRGQRSRSAHPPIVKI